MVSHLYNISFIFLTSPFMVDFIVYIRVIRVIRSSYHPLFSFVIMSFCLQEFPFLRPSLCYSVLKHSSVFVRLPVILSLIYSVCLMLKCLYKEAYKGPEKRRGICIRSEYVTIMYSDGYG